MSEEYTIMPAWKSFWELLRNRLKPQNPANLMNISRLVHQKYSEPHRAHHTLDHIVHCLEEFENVKQFIRKPHEVELAIWLHDLEYDPRRNDNEKKTAEAVFVIAADLDISAATAYHVHQMVLASRHKSIPPMSSDEAYFLDIDLAILGQIPEVYEEYAAGIRKEYDFLLLEDYKFGRVNVLQKFLRRRHIYHTGYFRYKYEVSARNNIASEIKRWSA